MELNDLKIFKIVAKKQSVSKAAKELGYAQSNISMRIQVLEKELGTKLFIRSKKGSELTLDGEWLLEYTKKILTLTNEIKIKFNKQKTNLVVAGKQTILSGVIPNIMKGFKKINSDVEISIKESSQINGIEGLLKNEIDCLFSYEEIIHRDIITKYKYRDEVVLVSVDKIENIKNINNKIIISSIKDCPYTKFALKWIKDNDLDSQKIIMSDSLESVIILVKSGLGIAFLPKSIMGNYKELYFKELNNQDSNVNIYFSTIKYLAENSNISLILNILKQKYLIAN